MFYLFCVDRKESHLPSVLNTYLPVCGLPIPDLTWTWRGRSPVLEMVALATWMVFRGPQKSCLSWCRACWHLCWVGNSQVWGMLRNQLCSLIFLGHLSCFCLMSNNKKVISGFKTWGKRLTFLKEANEESILGLKISNHSGEVFTKCWLTAQWEKA